MPKTYTEEEVEQLKKEWDSDLFEQKTNQTLHEVVRRLDLSNAYKETFGKDLVVIKEDVKELRLRVLEQENARLREATAAKEAKEKETQALKDAQDAKSRWYQDRWIRAGIAAGIVWEAWTIFGEPIKIAAHHLGWG